MTDLIAMLAVIALAWGWVLYAWLTGRLGRTRRGERGGYVGAARNRR